MPSLIDRVTLSDGVATLMPSGLAVVEVERALRGAENLKPSGLPDGLEPIDVVTALAWLGLEGLGPALVQRKPTRPWLGRLLGADSVASLIPRSPATRRLTLSAGLLQIHDFWDASHEAAQEADDRGEGRFAPYWHGIAHRREPDPGNASYWFRRVGRDPLFEELGAEGGLILDSEELDRRPDWADRVIRPGAWDPFAFIEGCSRVRKDTGEESLARRLQRLEMDRLLAATWQAAV